MRGPGFRYTQQIGVSLQAEEVAKVKAFASTSAVSLASWTREAIRQRIAREELDSIPVDPNRATEKVIVTFPISVYWNAFRLAHILGFRDAAGEPDVSSWLLAVAEKSIKS